MRSHEYQHDISSLLAQDSTGMVSGLVLQLDSILTEGSINGTTQKILDETIQFLHALINNNSDTELSSQDHFANY